MRRARLFAAAQIVSCILAITGYVGLVVLTVQEAARPACATEVTK